MHPDAPQNGPLDPHASISNATERVISYAQTTWRQCRPWKQFYSTRALSIPPFAALSDRVSVNLHVYRANYQVIIATWLVCILLRSIPSFLLAAVIFFAIERYAARRMLKNNNVLPARDKLVIALIVLLVIWLTDIGSFAVSALALSAITVSIHAAFHETDAVETEIATV